MLISFSSDVLLVFEVFYICREVEEYTDIAVHSAALEEWAKIPKQIKANATLLIIIDNLDSKSELTIQ